MIENESLVWWKKSNYEAADWQTANQFFKEKTGLKAFFSSETDRSEFENWLNGNSTENRNDDAKTEFGDFQTNLKLARAVCQLLFEKGVRPTVMVEPTFGEGNFIRAALETFPSIEKIVGVEIFKPYIWKTQLSICEFFGENPSRQKPKIELWHASVFEVDFSKIIPQVVENELLVLGNPPWVTNAALSQFDSKNLPEKSNFKKMSGLDSITGKGNFDLGESITNLVLRAFSGQSGHLAFLVKNAVIKNVLYEQRRSRFQIADLEQWEIDAPQEFGAAVDASLFYGAFQKKVGFQCQTFDFYGKTARRTFGWLDEKMVSDFENYDAQSHFDGVSPFEWRQGVKHDCSKIMELERENGHFKNGFGQAIRLENGLVFDLLKSSDLKAPVVSETRKCTILTQRKIGQSTQYIESEFPKTWAYLMENKPFFEARKSIIYKNSPDFAIFGIGDYSFKPFKVAISGLYKSIHFSLVLPLDEKPIMLDDTCYFIGFSTFAEAALVWAALNSVVCQRFLKSIVFLDAKRPITKDVLMRIDLKTIFAELDFSDFEMSLKTLQPIENQHVTKADWESMLDRLEVENATQLLLF